MKVNNLLANLVVIIALGFSAIFWYWQLYPYNPLVIKQPVKVLTKEVDAGGVVFVEFNFQKNTEVIPHVSISLVDGVVYNLPEFNPINETGETTGKVVGFEIPANVPCGDYHFHWIAEYKINPIRNIAVPYESEKFYINSTICAE